MEKSIANYSYPNSNLNEYNLDWLIMKMAELEAARIWQIYDSYNALTETLTLSVVSSGDAKKMGI